MSQLYSIKAIIFKFIQNNSNVFSLFKPLYIFEYMHSNPISKVLYKIILEFAELFWSSTNIKKNKTIKIIFIFTKNIFKYLQLSCHISTLFTNINSFIAHITHLLVSTWPRNAVYNIKQQDGLSLVGIPPMQITKFHIVNSIISYTILVQTN